MSLRTVLFCDNCDEIIEDGNFSFRVDEEDYCNQCGLNLLTKCPICGKYFMEPDVVKDSPSGLPIGYCSQECADRSEELLCQK